MTDVGLVCVLLIYVAWAARRALRGPAPLGPCASHGSPSVA